MTGSGNCEGCEFLGTGLGLDFGFDSAGQTEPKTEAVSVCPNRTDIGGKPRTFFFSTVAS